MSKSDLESTFAMFLRWNNLPEPSREYQPIARRRWRLDFAWPEQRAAVEIEGGVWTNGRHTRGQGFTADCEKYNEMTLNGWRLIRVTAEQVEDGSAIQWTKRLLNIGQGDEPAPAEWGKS